MKKTVLTFVLAWLVALNGLVSSAGAAGNAPLEEAYKAYKALLEKSRGEAFNLVDINQDGIPELIVDSLQVYTYYDGNVEELLDSWVIIKLYYSEETGNWAYHYEWQGTSDWYIFKIDFSERSEYGSYTHFVETLHRSGDNYTNDIAGEEPGQVITLEEYNRKLDAHLPSRSEIVAMYPNNEENRTKYLTVQTVPSKVVATPSTSKIMVDGKEVKLQAYNINDNNYFKLRDIAAILDKSSKQFAVDYDPELQSIKLTTGQSYTFMGGELAAAADSANKEAAPTSSEIYLNDNEIKLVAYNIGGNNYFKLRDLGKAIDFGITWDGTNQVIKIVTSEGYQE